MSSKNHKSTLGELRLLFNGETKIYLINPKSENKIEISYNYLLLGTDGFEEIPVYSNDIYAIGRNKIEIKLRIPVEVFEAWVNYAKKHKEV